MTAAVLSNRSRGRIAEARAIQLAASVGLEPSKPDPDAHGFDFYLNVPGDPRRAAEPGRFLSGSIPALVQVKGTVGRRIAVRLRVWEKLIEAPVPVFFIVFVFPTNKSTEPTKTYLVHLQGALLATAAERLWGAAGNIPAGATMDLTWSAAQELTPADGSALLARLRTEIGDPSEYTRAKLHARQTVGADDGPTRIEVSRTVVSRDALDQEQAEFAVGLRDSFPVDRIDRFDVRFGQPRLDVTRSGGPGVLAWPDGRAPMKSCQITLSDDATGTHLRVAAEFALSHWLFPDLDRDKALMRVRHPLVEWVFHPAGTSHSARFQLPVDGASVRELATAAKIWKALTSPTHTMELHSDRTSPLRLNLTGTFAQLTADQQYLLEAGRLAAEIFALAGISDDQSLSLAQLESARTALLRVSAFLSEDPSQVSFTLDIDDPPAGSVLAMLVPMWLRIGAELVALHGLIYGRCVRGPGGAGTVVPRGSGRVLVARRMTTEDVLDGTDGYIGDAVAKLHADDVLEGVVGIEKARESWQQVRPRLLGPVDAGRT